MADPDGTASMTYVCGQSIAGIAGSNPSEGMFIHLITNVILNTVI